MQDGVRTLAYVAVAVGLGAAALLLRPSAPTVEVFTGVGEPFYPDFEDPLAAASLEVIGFDRETGEARPFKVQVVDGVWSIPSHSGYPADGEERLASTAAAMIDLRRDAFASDRADDHASFGVVDPLDPSGVLEGRGTRVTLRDASGGVLADYVVGEPVEGRPGFRYVRLPDKKRTYQVRMEVELSTRFADWIETNLLDLTAGEIRHIEVFDYSIDEGANRASRAGIAVLDKVNDVWQLDEVPEGQELDVATVRGMTTALAGLTITGVRPKPASLSADLTLREGIQLDPMTRLNLESKGYYVATDGRLLSNEGEVVVGTREGVVYTLRFGEVLYGEGLGVSAGLTADAEGDGGAAENAAAEASGLGPENRYLFLTVDFDESLLPPRPQPPTKTGGADEVEGPPAPGEEVAAEPGSGEVAQQAYETALAQWTETAERGRAEAERLNERFAPWYFVISAADFRSIRVGVDDLVTPIEPADGEPSGGAAPALGVDP